MCSADDVVSDAIGLLRTTGILPLPEFASSADPGDTELGNTYRHNLPQWDNQGQQLFLIRKERGDLPNKMDLVMAGVLSWEARDNAIVAGGDAVGKQWSFGAV